ncbi:unnamed protein product [Victoria cruziana]
MRKKVDERIRTLIENGVKKRHRSMFVIVGDKHHYQIVNLHHMMRQATVKPMTSVLWCYKKNLQLSSHQKKRMKQIKKMRQRGLLDVEKEDSYLLFLDSEKIRYCYYSETENILGGTYGMCVLQDFEGLTPNILARTIETVEGGGLVLLLLSSLTSLTSLYTMVMDVHKRFRTEAHPCTASRFNERFLLSLASCEACIVMDDELNILPISSHIWSIAPVPAHEGSIGLSESELELKNLKEQLHDDFPVGPLIGKCRTLDQGKAVISFLDALLEKSLRMTVALTAARGRGKSAALGLAIAGAIAAGYSNIFVTAPSPENLKTLFEFISKGLEALDYKEHMHYESIRNPDCKNATVRVNVFKQHRQTIQYIQPQDREKLSQVELLVIDEAAAIPLPVVTSLLGPYMTFLSSTVNGYEGTGRSLSLKLFSKLEMENHLLAKKDDKSLSGSFFRKIELNESIRYAAKDPIESWLHGLLCLDATNQIPRLNSSGLPPPSECDLYHVNRDTLFSYHKESEIFLQRMMALYVSSHYKNSPNDLQLMADAPAHHLFVMLGKVDESKNQLPDILCVIQVCLEGQISRESVIKSLSHGNQPSGDQIPWKFSEQFQDNAFPSLSGARIVRIAVHPDIVGSRYGSAAVDLLTRYYEGQLTIINEAEYDDPKDGDFENASLRVTEAAEKVSLLEESIKPRGNLPPLLVHVQERRPEKLHYIGVSFGLNWALYGFWIKNKFAPFYISQIPNAVTGEHTCMMLRPLYTDDVELNEANDWGFLDPFYQDFSQRFVRLLGSSFRSLHPALALRILEPRTGPKKERAEMKGSTNTTNGVLGLEATTLTPYDMKRLESYTDNRMDFHLILDLVPVLSRLYFGRKLPVELDYIHKIILVCIGLQNQDFTYLKGVRIPLPCREGHRFAKEVQLSGEQITASIFKVMTRIYRHLHGLATKEIESTLPRLKEIVMLPDSRSVEDDLNDAAKQVVAKMNEEDQDYLLNPDVLKQYAIVGQENEFEAALVKGQGKISSSGIVSIKSSRRKVENGKVKLKNGKKRENDRGKHNPKKRKL